MASISTEAGGKRTVQVVGGDGKRRSIRLGKVSQRAAEAFRFRVEQLHAASLLGQAMDAETARWAAELDPRTVKKLAGVGLIPQPELQVAATLAAFLDEYTARRIDVKPATKEVWQQVVRNLRDYFGAQRALASITEGDADDFKMFLVQEGLASTTIHKRLQFARMFFRAAWKRKLIGSNPFAEVTTRRSSARIVSGSSRGKRPSGCSRCATRRGG